MPSDSKIRPTFQKKEIWGAAHIYFFIEYKISANIENENVTCTNKVAKHAKISANIMSGKILHHSTRAKQNVILAIKLKLTCIKLELKL